MVPAEEGGEDLDELELEDEPVEGDEEGEEEQEQDDEEEDAEMVDRSRYYRENRGKELLRKW